MCLGKSRYKHYSVVRTGGADTSRSTVWRQWLPLRNIAFRQKDYKIDNDLNVLE